LRRDEYRWWVARVQHHLQCYDVTRIDHFRGLVAYWEVPAEAETAATGRWVPVPTQNFFERLIKRFGNLPVIAEDLGSITADVREVIRNYRFPGMRVLQFAFGSDFPKSDFLPHRHDSNTVVYTGTHDNNTTLGWFEEETDPQIRKNLFSYVGREVAAGDLPWELIRLALLSIADTAIVPLQDILGLGSEARMNHPGRSTGNWRWRHTWSDQDTDRADRLREMTACYGRL
jgi:4-alpha-glucanotransferase